jgi:AraC-like DNA-binding protein
MNVPCLSARFVPPFAQVLATYEQFAPEALNRLKAIDPTTRIPAAVAHELAAGQVAETGDPDLGFKAAKAMPLGRAGALDYVMHSAPTVREAIEVGDRYIRSFSDVLNVRHDVDGTRARIRLEVSCPMPRAIIDFTMSAWYANHLRAPLSDATQLECWFAHSKPSHTEEYERAFAPATLRFDAPFNGFAFDREHLDAPLASADATTHAVLCEHVALAVAHLTMRRTLVARVREITMRDLLHGGPSVFSVACQLRMSARTLGRRLEREGTTFSAVLDQLRKELALGYVGNHTLGFTDIAFRLGFSHVEAFHRAFKRWTGQTPLTYRRARLPPSPLHAT